MARIVKEYAVRRNEILDVAQRLVYTKGYEQMAIQDILDDLQIAKGTFYHYFGSKQTLLEATIERMLEEAERLLLPIVQDSHLPALEKFQRFFTALARWKTEQKTFILALLRVWYMDDNAIVREKARSSGLKQFMPLLMTIIRQGIEEGVFTPAYPDQVGDVVMSLMQGLNDILARLLLSFEYKDDDLLQRVVNAVAAYTDALERVLGAPIGSLLLTDTETLEEWVVLLRDNA